MPHRMNGGLAVAAIGAVILIVSLFLDWFSPGRSAWTVFELNDLILAGLGLLVLSVMAEDLGAGQRTDRYLPEGGVVYAGIGALIIVAASLIQPPPGALHSSREVGAWLALLGSVLITAGGILMRMRISLVIMLRGADRQVRSPIFSQETVDAPAVEPEDYDAYGAEPYEPEPYEADEYEAEEPGVDPDAETRQFSEPSG